MSISNSAEETAAMGEGFGAVAGQGDVLALKGDLGAGKTEFVKGFVSAMGSSAQVTSPTFTLLHEYPSGRLPVYHFDFYRLEKPEAALQLGLDDYLFGDGISIIEWADRFPGLIPDSATWVFFEITSETTRMISASKRP